MGRKNKFYAVARRHQTGIFKSWEQCQNQTRGFKKADYKSFDTKKEAEEWLMTQPLDKENHDEANEHNEKELAYPEELETTHCKTKCKYGGDDEKSDTMIECCLCKRWYHVQCVALTEKEGEEKSDENLENENEKQQRRMKQQRVRCAQRKKVKMAEKNATKQQKMGKWKPMNRAKKKKTKKRRVRLQVQTLNKFRQ